MGDEEVVFDEELLLLLLLLPVVVALVLFWAPVEFPAKEEGDGCSITIIDAAGFPADARGTERSLSARVIEEDADADDGGC